MKVILTVLLLCHLVFASQPNKTSDNSLNVVQNYVDIMKIYPTFEAYFNKFNQVGLVSNQDLKEIKEFLALKKIPFNSAMTLPQLKKNKLFFGKKYLLFEEQNNQLTYHTENGVILKLRPRETQAEYFIRLYKILSEECLNCSVFRRLFIPEVYAADRSEVARSVASMVTQVFSESATSAYACLMTATYSVVAAPTILYRFIFNFFKKNKTVECENNQFVVRMKNLEFSNISEIMEMRRKSKTTSENPLTDLCESATAAQLLNIARVFPLAKGTCEPGQFNSDAGCKMPVANSVLKEAFSGTENAEYTLCDQSIEKLKKVQMAFDKAQDEFKAKFAGSKHDANPRGSGSGTGAK